MAKKIIKVELEVDFILEAHKAACNEWKRRLEKQFPDLFKGYRKGNKFHHSGNGQTYILANPSGTDMCLINIRTGARWDESVECASDSVVTFEEFSRIAGRQEKDFQPFL